MDYDPFEGCAIISIPEHLGGGVLGISEDVWNDLREKVLVEGTMTWDDAFRKAIEIVMA